MLITLTETKTDMTAEQFINAVHADSVETSDLLAICAEAQQIYAETLEAMGMVGTPSVPEVASAATFSVSLPRELSTLY